MARSGATPKLRVIIMSDNSNADTESDEQTVAELKERIGELEERVEQQEEAQRGTSRRQFLGSLTGIASAGAAGYYLGTQRAQAAPSWGSASGQMGTDSTPLSDVIAQTGTFQSLSTDNRQIANKVARAFLSADQSVPDTTTETLNFDDVSSTNAVDDYGAFDTANNEFVVPSEAEGDYLASVSVGWASDSGWSTGDQAKPRVENNGAAVFSPDLLKIGTSNQTIISPPTLLTGLTQGDTLSAAAFQDSGSPKTVQSLNSRTQFTIYYIG